MYKFFGYGVETPNHGPHFFKTRQAAIDFCKQIGAPEKYHMLYKFEQLPYVEPKNPEGWVEP